MQLFALVFCSVYALVQLYLYYKIRAAFPAIGFWSVPVVLFLGMMVFAPIGVRVLDTAGYPRMALAMSTPAHSWLAIMLWFLTLSLACDGWNLAAQGLSRLSPVIRQLVVSPKGALAISGVLILAAASWGMHEASSVRLKQLTLTLRNLPKGTKPIRLVQISDMHLGLFMREKMLMRVVGLINEARPDVLVSTGDLVDSSFHQPKLAVHLAMIKAPLGKYAVFGNHEAYAGISGSMEFHQAAGFRVLRGDSVLVAPGLRIAGVDDPACAGNPHGVILDGGFVANPAGEAMVLLKHRSRVGKEHTFDLQLSGHTHGGQIFPWIWVLKLVDTYTAGLYKFADGSSLYVSNGTGTWGPPMRLFAPPEVTLIILQPEG